MTIALFLLLAFQQPTGQAPARPPATTQTPAQPGAATPAPAAPRRVVPTTATLEIRVVDRSGRPISDAHVVVQGPTSREDTTDKSGTTTFKTMTEITRFNNTQFCYCLFGKEILVCRPTLTNS